MVPSFIESGWVSAGLNNRQIGPFRTFLFSLTLADFSHFRLVGSCDINGASGSGFLRIEILIFKLFLRRKGLS